MSSQSINILKQIIDRKIEGTQPSCIIPGVVLEGGERPLIGYDTTHPIPRSLVIVPRHLTDYTVKVEIDGEEKEIKIKNSLQEGDYVLMIRNGGGQEHLIIDKQKGDEDNGVQNDS